MKIKKIVKGRIILGNHHEGYIAYKKRGKLVLFNLENLSEIQTTYKIGLFVYFNDDWNIAILGSENNDVYKLDLKDFSAEKITKKLRLPLVNPICFTSKYICFHEAYSNELVIYEYLTKETEYHHLKDYHIYSIHEYDEERFIVTYLEKNKYIQKLGLMRISDFSISEIDFNQEDINTYRSIQCIQELNMLIFLTKSKLMILSKDLKSILKEIKVSDYCKDEHEEFNSYTYNKYIQKILYCIKDKLYYLDLKDMSINFIDNIIPTNFLAYSHKNKTLAINSIVDGEYTDKIVIYDLYL